MSSRVSTLVMSAVVMMLGCAMPPGAHGQARDRDTAEKEVEFGIEMARRQLWNEAVYRFERATELDSTYAAAFNNLAVAYEQTGRFEQARRMYERARSLDGDNSHIRLNQEWFFEVDDRRNRPEK